MPITYKSLISDISSFTKKGKGASKQPDLQSITPGLWQRPRSVWHAQFIDALWIVMKVYRITGQSAIQRGSGIQKDPINETFKFLAPLEIVEALNHEWAEYDSISTRLGQKIATWQRDLSEGGQALQGLRKEAENIIGKWQKGEGATGIRQTLANVATRIEGIKVQQRKVDAALVYTNSGRRSYQFTFNLIDEGNPQADIMEVVNKISSYSCAKGYEHGVKFENPYIFEVTTEPNGWLKIDNAALESVQPTYRSPYRNGLPTVCELTLAFKDLDPLYRNTLNRDFNVVTVSSTLPLGAHTAAALQKQASQSWLSSYQDRFAIEMKDIAQKIPGGLKGRAFGELSDNMRNVKSKSTEKAYQKINNALHGA